jgi:hypothetical protein
MEAAKTYMALHAHRLHLLFGGMLSDKENENINKKIESWGRKHKVAVVSDRVPPPKKTQKIKAKTIPNQ